ncbi:HK97 gp10 family phage protein [Streptococcus suis]
MSKIKVDGLSKAVMDELNRYSKTTNEEVKSAVKEVAKEVKQDIQATAPKRTGKYSKSWVVKNEKQSANGLSLVVHSKTKYQLTHLLEFGHAKRGGGRVAARPHIAQAEEKGMKLLEEKIKEKISYE